MFLESLPGCPLSKATHKVRGYPAGTWSRNKDEITLMRRNDALASCAPLDTSVHVIFHHFIKIYHIIF